MRASPFDLHMKQLAKRSEERTRAVAAITGRVNPDYASYVLDLIEPGISGAREARDVTALSREIENVTGYVAKGIWVPLQRDLTVGTPTAGGNLTQRPLDGGLVEALSPHSAVVAAGAAVVSGMTGNSFGLPKLDSMSSAAWIAENDSAPSSEPTFDQVMVSPRTVAVTITLTRQLIRNTHIKRIVENALATELKRAVMVEVDRAALAGTGVGAEPTGILNHADVSVVAAGTNGAAPSWDLLADMEYAVSESGAIGPGAWITNAAVRRKLRKTPRIASGDAVVWPGADLLGYPAHVSEHAPHDLDKGSSTGVCSAIVHGLFQHIFIGIWGPSAYDLIIDPYNYGPSGKVRLIAMMDVGIGIRHPQAFSVCKDVLTS